MSPLKVLHVLSQHEFTGAETYALVLGEYQKSQGFEVEFVSDDLTNTVGIVLHRRPISQRGFLTRIKNIFFLRKLFKEKKFDIVHAHSRAASWVCWVARLGLKIPLVSTVHGKQHLHQSSRLLDIYGDQIIAICENIKAHLVRDFGINEKKISLLRNPFHFQPELTGKPANNQMGHILISIIGRASNTKGDRACQLIEQVFFRLMREFPNLKLRLVGGGLSAFKKYNQEILSRCLHEFKDRFEISGFVKDLRVSFSDSDLVIAAGRTAVEAMHFNKTLFAFGEGESLGVVSRINMSEALLSNFGDCRIKEKDPDEFEKVYAELLQWLRLYDGSADSSATLKTRIEEEFGVEKIFIRMKDIYLSARAKKLWPRPVPILMYHRVVNSAPNTKHKTFVLKETFERQLHSLRRRNFSSLSFQDYEDFRTKKLPLEKFPKKPIFISFDDAYEDNLENALPLLEKYNFKACLFCLSDHQILKNFWDKADGEISKIMTEEQKRTAGESRHFEIGSHGISHRDLTTLDQQELKRELEQSKRELQKLYAQPVLAFAYPFGIANERVREAVIAAGYKFAVLTDRGERHIEDDLFSIFRVNMFPTDEGVRFWRKTQWWYRYWYDFSRSY